MDRCAVFVDAGYLLAEGAKEYVHPRAKRGDAAIEYRELTARLCELATEACNLPLLRTYWYDGAEDGVPTRDHLTIAAQPDVKVRLGRRTKHGQKGVDGLLYRDLSVLARERAIATAFLLSGDEDLREGVVTAQELGVHITLWGMGRDDNQARTLRAEVDRWCYVNDDLGPLFSPAAGSTFALSRASEASSSGAPPSVDQVSGTAAEFAHSWVSRADVDDISGLLADRPSIPNPLDAELLRYAQAAHGDLRPYDNLRRAVRASFWEAIESAAHQADSG